MLQFSKRKIFEIQRKITPDCLLCDGSQANMFAIIDLFVISECRNQRDENQDFDGESTESHGSSIYAGQHFWGFHIFHSLHYNTVITSRTNKSIHCFE